MKRFNIDEVFNIEFKNVDFTYKKTGIKIFESFNLKINKGEKLGIIGNVGSGKTTLLDLISRIYDPDKGIVVFNDNDIKDYRLKILGAK